MLTDLAIYKDGPLPRLPTEIRLMIINELLPPGPIIHSWLAEERELPMRSSNGPEPRRHGLLYVNRVIHQEYSEELYKRTKFFLYVDQRNMAVSHFWPLLRPNLSNGVRHIRRCTIYFDAPAIYRERTAEYACDRLNSLKTLVLGGGFVKLEELRVIVQLPARNHVFSHGPVEITDAAIRNGWLQDMMKLPRLSVLWLTIGKDVDERVKRVGKRWYSAPVVLSRAVTSIMLPLRNSDVILHEDVIS